MPDSVACAEDSHPLLGSPSLESKDLSDSKDFSDCIGSCRARSERLTNNVCDHTEPSDAPGLEAYEGATIVNLIHGKAFVFLRLGCSSFKVWR